MFGAQVLHDRCSEEDIGARQIKKPECVVDSVVSLSPELRGELNTSLHQQILFLDFFVVTVHLVLRKKINGFTEQSECLSKILVLPHFLQF